MFATIFADLRYTLRRLRAQPGYALLASLTLALGVGGTASTYAVARSVLFEPLPYANEREVGMFWKKTDWTPRAEPVVILSFGLWQDLGGSPSILGTRVTLDGVPRTVVGVMPRGFWFPDPSVRVWTPEPLTPESRSWNSTLVGRVAPGNDVRAMGTPVAGLTSMLDERFDYPAQWDKTKNAHITPLRDDLTGAMHPRSSPRSARWR
jgi:hypothetical protein